MRSPGGLRFAIGTAAVLLLAGALVAHEVPAPSGGATAGSIVIGAVYPLSLPEGAPPRNEYDGLRTAVAITNAHGGIHGRRVVLDLASVKRRDDAPAAVLRLARQHVSAIVGSSESLVAVPASEAAQGAGVFYLESGAVATMLTEPGHPDVFRTVVTGQTLGRSAADFAARTIGPRLHLSAGRMRVAVVWINDAYGSSVAASELAETRRLGMRLVFTRYYAAVQKETPKRFSSIVRELKAARPNVVLVAAYLQDAVAFRRETVRLHLRVGAMIGTSSSFCMPQFGAILGRAALGLFASDKPDIHVNQEALGPTARRMSRSANAWYRRRFGADMTGPAVAGFVAGWVLLHDIIARAHTLTADRLRQAALSVNLPYGSEINGAGVKFAGPGEPDEGENLRATSVVWQWQGIRHAVVVSPADYATGNPRWIPLPTNL